MDSKADNSSTGVFWKVAIPVLVALISAGSAPWWSPSLSRWIFPPPYMGQLRWGQNYQGSDIENIDRPEVNTAGECSMLCEKEDRCKAMTFVMHNDKPGGICWLKDAVPPLTKNGQMVSAEKVFP
ncbi:PAN domain-containing protein [Burkholderia ubonensis]|uniref:PAN domain-containing protein n=1 Tax=Burkholderia ubonensis TaxID=101571 RepID=UPI0012F868B4|nr:PAN domain-containing protein [Burkholderia ubonensis]